jgi:hypothetical protein
MKGTNNRLVSTYSKAKPMAIMNSNGPAVMASSKKDFGTDRYQMRSCMVLPVVEAVVVLVIDRHRVDLRLEVTDLVNRLHLQATRAPAPGKARPTWAKPRWAM